MRTTEQTATVKNRVIDLRNMFFEKNKEMPTKIYLTAKDANEISTEEVGDLSKELIAGDIRKMPRLMGMEIMSWNADETRVE